MQTIWEPHPGKQTEALSRPEDEILYGGARGGGKTEAGLAWLVEPEYYNNPLYKALVIRRNADDLFDWIARARVFYRGLAEISGKPPVIWLNPGGYIRTGHLKDADAYNKYLGHEYHKILIEELTQIPRLQDYLNLISTCRSSVSGLKPQVFCTTNPGGVGHKWVRARFVDVAKEKTYYDKVSGKTRIFIPARVEDNPTLIKNDPNYILFLESLPERLRRAWRYGDWDAFEGQFFEDFDPAVHSIKPFMIPKEWTLYGSLDPGWSSPCSFGLRAKDFEGNVYRIFTYYQKERSPVEHAEGILKMIRNCPYTEGRMPSVIVSGHDAFAHKDRYAILNHEMTFADIFRMKGLHLQKANTDRHNGWWALKQMIRDRKWFYFEGMNDALVEEIIEAESDDRDPEDIKGRGNSPDVSDHALDEERYGIMAIYTPRVFEEEMPMILKKDAVSFADIIEEEPLRKDIRRFWE